MRPISLTKENITDSAIRRLLFDAGEDIDALMMLCEADITSKNKVKVKRYLQNFEMVRAHERSGRERSFAQLATANYRRNHHAEIWHSARQNVGVIKDAIREAILDGIIPNTYESAYTFYVAKG